KHCHRLWRFELDLISNGLAGTFEPRTLWDGVASLVKRLLTRYLLEDETRSASSTEDLAKHLREIVGNPIQKRGDHMKIHYFCFHCLSQDMMWRPDPGSLQRSSCSSIETPNNRLACGVCF